MKDQEAREALALAAVQASDASHVLFVAAQLASVLLKSEAADAATALKVTAAAEAARVVSVAATEAELVLRKGRATALLNKAILPPPPSRLAIISLWASGVTLAVAVSMVLILGWWLLYPLRMGKVYPRVRSWSYLSP